jgi:hypothetical protein
MSSDVDENGSSTIFGVMKQGVELGKSINQMLGRTRRSTQCAAANTFLQTD